MAVKTPTRESLHPDELETVQAAQRGDHTAQLHLLHHFRFFLQRQTRLLRRSLSLAEAEDARQDVYCLFFELLHAYDPTQNDRFDAYLYTMLKWRVYNLGRRVEVHNVRSYLPCRVVFFLMNRNCLRFASPPPACPRR